MNSPGFTNSAQAESWIRAADGAMRIDDDSVAIFKPASVEAFAFLAENDKPRYLRSLSQLPNVERRLIEVEVAQWHVPADFNLLSADELVRQPSQPDLVKGVLPSRGVASLYAPPMGAKTFLALDLMRAIDQGEEWFGYRTRSAPVVYLALEGAGGIGRRVAALIRRHGPLNRTKFITQPFKLNVDDHIEALNRSITEADIELGAVIMSTLWRGHRSDWTRTTAQTWGD